MRQKRHSYIFLKSVPTPEFLHYRALVCGYGKNKSRSSALLQNINHYLLYKAVRELEKDVALEDGSRFDKIDAKSTVSFRVL